MTWQEKWSCDLQHSILALTGPEEWSERPNQINQLIMSSPSIYMNVSTIFFKLLLWQKSIQPNLFLLYYYNFIYPEMKKQIILGESL